MSKRQPHPDPQRLVGQIEISTAPLPVDSWQPALSGDMDLCIEADGRWLHQGEPIRRQRLLQLFARILRRDEDGEYYLVTPAEKWRIQVRDAPFRALAVRRLGAPGPQQVLSFETDLAGVVAAGPQHPLRVEYRRPGDEPRPYLRVRGRLDALVSRSTFIELAEFAELAAADDETAGLGCYRVWSQGQSFTLAQA